MNSVGIDLDERQVSAVTVDERGTVIARSSTPAAPDLGAAIRQVYRGARGDYADTGAAGVSVARDPGDLPREVSAALADESGAAPIAVTAGQATALAESWCGAARGAANVISFSIGEHVTAGLLVDGRVLRGAHGRAGSVAWLALNPVEREDYRRHGGLEAEVAAAGLVRRLVWRIKSGDRSRVVQRVNGELSRLTAEDVFAAAREGDGVCVSVVRDTAKYVGMAIANIAAVIDPECVVLGGTLAASGDLMLDAIRSECGRRLWPGQSDLARIVLAALGDDARAIGAARAARLQDR
jgi:glucokinase